VPAAMSKRLRFHPWNTSREFRLVGPLSRLRAPAYEAKPADRDVGVSDGSALGDERTARTAKRTLTAVRPPAHVGRGRRRPERVRIHAAPHRLV
jgi:hypothetical protein